MAAIIKPLIAVALTLLTMPVMAADETKKSSPVVVSFAPSISELLYAIKAEDSIVGVCSFCDFPANIKSKERVGSFTAANLEKLARLHPSMCLLVRGQEGLASQLKRNNFQTLILPNSSLADISSNLKSLGEFENKKALAEAKSKAFSNALESLKIILQKQNRPKVFYCTWPTPLITVGQNSYLNEVITTCGGINITGEMKQDYPRLSLERLVLNDPDIIIFPFEARNQKFLHNAPWSNLRAIRNKQFYFLEAPENDRLSRPSLRLLEGLQWLSSKLHPNLEHELKVWQSNQSRLLNQS